MQHIHILGICGTFMGSLAQLAKAKGFRVTGCDERVYPPMSTQLEAAGIELIEGFDESQLSLNPDCYVIGNVVARGNPLMETILNRGLPFTSGPQWFAQNIINDRWVLAVSGTHGKTTTSSMLAWILDYAGYDPGYLIGGVPNNFGVSARLGSSGFFVVEADEYDCAFFDKRSKFIHYRPRTLVINNLEFDHADIFADLQAIQTQFHHLIRTVAQEGLIVYPEQDTAIAAVLERGCWSDTQTLGGYWQGVAEASGGFKVLMAGELVGQITWELTGDHNINNALAAIAAARHVGVEPQISCEALSQFKSVKRRMECVGEVNNIRVFDDFAHHPTAIKTTLAGLREQLPNAKITAIIEPRSNTMKQGVHKEALPEACSDADAVYWLQADGIHWSLFAGKLAKTQHNVLHNVPDIVAKVVAQAERGENIVVMSNGAFGGIHKLLVAALGAKFPT